MYTRNYYFVFTRGGRVPKRESRILYPVENCIRGITQVLQ